MPSCCCAYKCSNRASASMKLFAIPSGERNRERREIWLNNISRKDFIPTIHTKLCEVHFTEDQFERQRKDNVRKLKPDAIPTIFHHLSAFTKRTPRLKKQCSVSSDVPKVIDHNYYNSSDNIDEFPVSNKDSSEKSLQEEPKEMQHDEILVTSSVSTISISEDIETLKRKLDLAENKISKLTKENNNLLNKFSKLFNDDQLDFFRNESNEVTWSDETIQKSLRMRLSCGSKGYNFLRNDGHPLPTERTLQQHIQKFKLNPGIDSDILKLLHLKTKTMLPEERYAILMIDEMAISERLDFDITTAFVLGKTTLPSAGGSLKKLPTHALVFMIGGASTSWKQVVGYHFTGNSVCSKSLKQTVFQLIKQCESAGLLINFIVSDMGRQTRALWRECGIVAGEFSIVRNHCPHPCGPERKLFFMPDSPHLLKSVRNHLISG